jgi:hypothetical protein
VLQLSQYDLIYACSVTNIVTHFVVMFTILFNYLWWFFRGCSPLPIPNREVKPLMADGTAPQCGRVGSCHIYLKKPLSNERLFYFIAYPLRHFALPAFEHIAASLRRTCWLLCYIEQELIKFHPQKCIAALL